MSLSVSRPESLLRPLVIPRLTMMGPGPVACAPRVVASFSHQMLPTYACNDSLVDIMKQVRQGLQYVFQTNNQHTFAVSGAAHAALECALLNTLEPGEVVLVTVHGLWGERASEIAERHDAKVKQIRKDLGQVFTLEELQQGLEEHRPAILFMTHGESTGGTLQPLKGVGELCHKYNCLLVIDAVATVGAIPFFMDEWGIDVVITGAHKCLGGPVGVSPISFSTRAWKKIETRVTKIRSFYLDAKLLAQCWGAMEPMKYHHTCLPINVYGLREALAMITEEGLEAVWTRHSINSEQLWSGLEKLGLHMYVENKDYRLATVSLICVPDGVDWRAVVDYIREKHMLQIEGSLGPLGGKVWRIGMMAYNSSPYNVELAVNAMKDALETLKA